VRPYADVGIKLQPVEKDARLAFQKELGCRDRTNR